PLAAAQYAQRHASKEESSQAIIGIGCLFPKADGAKAYWSNIKEKVDGITEVPPTHWDPRDYFDGDPKSPDRTYGRRGGFLSPVDFDPTEFGISPNNIPATDPAQLLGLVVAQAAMRDAGYGPERGFDRRSVSVILGVTGTLELAIPLGARLGHPIWRRALREAGMAGEQAEAVIRRISDHYVEWQENSFPGLLGNVVAGRIANRLDLGGTNCVVDAACASSLSAAHLASLELASGRADMAVTGGVDTFNDIFMYMCFSKTPALSPTGDSRPFDAKGDGTILGEGIGMIVLKRLADAERDGDRIYAVLRGIGSSSDGRGKAIYAPSAEGQVQALKNAYRVAGVGPETVELVEAHGTGTKVGDAAELKALAEVYRESRRAGTWCALGSVKSNLGHTKAAAGAAGLIKAALALKHKVLPPTLKVTEPLAELGSGETPFYLNTEKRPWLSPEGHPRRAGVSAFGFGGSNFHAVLEEHRPEKPEIDWDGSVELAAFSAPDRPALLAQLDAWTGEFGWPELRVKAAASRRDFDPGLPLRLVVALERASFTPETFAAVRESARKSEGRASWSTPEGAHFSSAPRSGKLAALFPGQGAQYVGMGRDLACQFPAMHETLQAAQTAWEGPLCDRLYPRPSFTPGAAAAAEAALRATEAAQPAIGAVSLGMLRVLALFGVKPELAAGHSYGELTALCAAGRLSPEELHRLSKLRGRLMAAGGGDKGAMLAALAPLEQVGAALGSQRREVVFANKNAPEQVVLSGPTEAIRRAAQALDARGIRNAPLPVAAAFHSPLVADAERPLRDGLEACAFPAGELPVYANTTAEAYPAAAGPAKDLLAGQLARPVEFARQVENMHRDGARIFLEIGPGARLSGLVKAILGDREHAAIAVDASAGRRGGVADLARALAQLAAAGLSLDLTPWEAGAETLREAAARKKPKVVVRVSGATPSNPKGREPLPQPSRAAAAKPAAVPAPRATPAPAPAPTFVPASPAHDALRLSQEGITALQRLQEQASSLHRQFLEGQETAQKALLGLIEQQNRLLLGAPALSAFPAAPEPLRASSAPVTAPPAPEPPARDASRIQQALLSVVADKTGYPAETLNLDMGLESDLGIDSIKRVEILAAMRERLPDAPVVGPQHIGTLRTLRQIIEFLAQAPASAASPAAAAAPTGDSASEEITAALLGVVAEKTGYPAETLNLDMGLESDLGIDSIKRVEILAAMREKLPAAPSVGPEHIGTLRTLRQIIEFLSAGASAPKAPAPASRGPAPGAPPSSFGAVRGDGPAPAPV
ncbi:MAG: acyltransferase domain-containing protein, partial [Elusimicrobia bacterium]|nr:acyltransferase domain-containing protein [Elusimicrobiota bacterium]